MYNFVLDADEKILYLENAFMMIEKESLPITAAITNKRLLLFEDIIDEVAGYELLKTSGKEVYPPLKQVIQEIALEDIKDWEEAGLYNKYKLLDGTTFLLSNNGIIQEIFNTKKEV